MCIENVANSKQSTDVFLPFASHLNSAIHTVSTLQQIFVYRLVVLHLTLQRDFENQGEFETTCMCSCSALKDLESQLNDEDCAAMYCQ